jgi:hypothetical protein
MNANDANTAVVALQLLTQLGTAYASARDLAAKSGVTEEDLAAADARFQKVYTDPLATKPE